MKKMYMFWTLVSVLFLGSLKTTAQGVAINISGAPADPSAILDVSSSSQGALVPRMTAAERDAIVSPATGLIVFNTDCKTLNINAGTPSSPEWASVASSNALTAAVSVSASPSGVICSGTNVTFTATHVNGGTSPSYQWQVNGGNVGTDIPTYSTSGLNQGDVVVCLLTSNDACVTGPPVASVPLTMQVNYSIPSVPGVISGPAGVASNTPGVVYFISAITSATSYLWTVPAGAVITSGQGTTSITVNYGSGTVDDVTVAAINPCGTGPAQSLTVNVGIIEYNANGTGRTGSLQTFTVDISGTYIIEAWGAQGASLSGFEGGKGASMRGEFYLTAGTVLDILVGQTGETDLGGGGGGTFVVMSPSTPLVIAGGGGGAGGMGAGIPASIGTAGLNGEGGAGGTGGDNGGGGGGGGGYSAGGGGGFCGNGGDVGMSYCAGGIGGDGCVDGTDGDCGSCVDSKGMSYLNGGLGGTPACYPSQGDGGYGGGGAVAHGNNCGGGGGGYSGGGAGGFSYDHGFGGGGGSYNAGTNQSNTADVQTGNGKVVITF